MRIKSLIICFVLVYVEVVRSGFIKTRGVTFSRDGKPFYFNGFNAYWLMYIASEPSNRDKVVNAFSSASNYGMNVARTWAFNDGGNNRPLQISPGNYSEQVFKSLDFVVAEANKRGIYLILCLANNWPDFGGKKQYVQWAKLNSEDEFFTNPVVRGFYKNHVKTVLTRVNSITGVMYKDDPTILAWELMNEPRSQADLSGKSIQNWVTEMSSYIKSIDNNHLVGIGMEGYYGQSEKQANPNGFVVGTDFITNSRTPGIDYATIHIYPDQWLSNSTNAAQDQFGKQWIQSHIADSKSIGKPLIIEEFGKNSKSANYSVITRDAYMGNVFSDVYDCAKNAGPCVGALFWQLLAKGLENLGDGYEVILQQSQSTDAVIDGQSRRMASLNG